MPGCKSQTLPYFLVLKVVHLVDGRVSTPGFSTCGILAVVCLLLASGEEVGRQDSPEPMSGRLAEDGNGMLATRKINLDSPFQILANPEKNAMSSAR